MSDRYLMGELSPSKLRNGILSFGDDVNFTLMSHAVKTATASINTEPILRYFRGTWYKVALRVRQNAVAKMASNENTRIRFKNLVPIPACV